jgi:sterol desaturase/sphingolipid hydroxylase (fatty acid hydroxylase superfamily)
MDHHGFILKNKTSWKPNNLLLFNDNWKSTMDLWLTEVIPTIIFSFITGEWWIFVLYYVWAALIQESIEHNSKINLPILTSGRWHLVHHNKPDKNFGLFLPIWDIIFKTNERIL